MTNTNNGWSGKPGVPLNPEKDGWHWLRTPDGELVPYNWRPEGECERGSWAFGWVYDREYDWPPVECTYLGPVLSHDQATALQARCKEAERERAHQHGRADRNAAEYAREQAKREALQARVAELERLGKAIATERNQLIGVLQLAVEQSAETGENEPAWIGPACRILNAGFTKIAALEGKKE